MCLLSGLTNSSLTYADSEFTDADGMGIVTRTNIDIEGHHYESIKFYKDMGDHSLRIISAMTLEDELIIPSKIDGWSVTAIGGDFGEFKIMDWRELDTLSPWQLNKKQKYKKIVVPEGVIQIIHNGFRNVNSYCIELPKSLKNIGEKQLGYECCFENASIDHVIVRGNKTEIRGKAFANSKIKKLTLPKNYQGKIREYAFENSRLEKFKWPSYKSGVTTKMGFGAFQNCKNLKTITFPKNQKHIYIPGACFWGCKKLKKLTFPASTKKVTYRWSPYADNYKVGPKTLVFKGKKTTVAGAKFKKKKKMKLLTVDKIIAPKNSKALAYAKKAKRVKWIAKSLQKYMSVHIGASENFVDEGYGSSNVRIAKMKYSVLKK